MNHARVSMAAVAILMLSACGLTKSPADGLTFRAPDGWTGTPGIMGRFQLWTSPGDKDKQIVMLMKLPSDTKIDQSTDVASFKSFSSQDSLKDTKLLERKVMKLCNGTQSSIFMKMEGTSTNSHSEETVETVLSKAPDGTYMAMYMYPIGTAPDANVEASIYNLCPDK
jgi:hypothetical protein